jgi:hypothetical protein
MVSTMRVHIDTEAEAVTTGHIHQAEEYCSRRQIYDVPAELVNAYLDAWRALGEAEASVLRAAGFSEHDNGQWIQPATPDDDDDA